jgi:tetratricopeptide (TPR) repeat protein
VAKLSSVWFILRFQQGISALLLASAIGFSGQRPDVQNAEYFFKVAEMLRCAGKLAPAIDAYTNAIKAKNNFPDAYCQRGSALLASGDQDGALKDFERAIELAPRKPCAYNNRGNIRLLKMDYAGAIADFSLAIRLDPNHSDAYTNRAKANCILKEFDRAIADYDQAIQRMPSFSANGILLQSDKHNLARVYTGRGVARTGKTDLKDALADHNKALELDPNSIDAMNNRATVLFLKGELKEALADLDRAVQAVKSGNVEDHHSISYPYQLTTNLRYNSSLTAIYLNRGKIRYQLRDAEGAEADFKTLVQVDPDFAEAWFCLGRIHDDRGETDAAFADYRIMPMHC